MGSIKILKCILSNYPSLISFSFFECCSEAIM